MFCVGCVWSGVEGFRCRICGLGISVSSWFLCAVSFPSQLLFRTVAVIFVAFDQVPCSTVVARPAQSFFWKGCKDLAQLKSIGES